MTSKVSLSAAAYAADELLKLCDERLMPFGKDNVCFGCGARALQPHATDCIVQQVRAELRAVLKNYRPGGSDAGTPAREQVRLSRQAVAIRDRLLQGPATNLELSTLALKYTGRISDLRACGYEIYVVNQDHETGRVVYALKQ